jgi:hypothetical protein
VYFNRQDSKILMMQPSSSGGAFDFSESKIIQMMSNQLLFEVDDGRSFVNRQLEPKNPSLIHPPVTMLPSKSVLQIHKVSPDEEEKTAPNISPTNGVIPPKSMTVSLDTGQFTTKRSVLIYIN